MNQTTSREFLNSFENARSLETMLDTPGFAEDLATYIDAEDFEIGEDTVEEVRERYQAFIEMPGVIKAVKKILKEKIAADLDIDMTDRDLETVDAYFKEAVKQRLEFEVLTSYSEAVAELLTGQQNNEVLNFQLEQMRKEADIEADRAELGNQKTEDQEKVVKAENYKQTLGALETALPALRKTEEVLGGSAEQLAKNLEPQIEALKKAGELLATQVAEFKTILLEAQQDASFLDSEQFRNAQEIYQKVNSLSPEEKLKYFQTFNGPALQADLELAVGKVLAVVGKAEQKLGEVPKGKKHKGLTEKQRASLEKVRNFGLQFNAAIRNLDMHNLVNPDSVSYGETNWRLNRILEKSQQVEVNIYQLENLLGDINSVDREHLTSEQVEYLDKLGESLTSIVEMAHAGKLDEEAAEKAYRELDQSSVRKKLAGVFRFLKGTFGDQENPHTRITRAESALKKTEKAEQELAQELDARKKLEREKKALEIRLAAAKQEVFYGSELGMKVLAKAKEKVNAEIKKALAGDFKTFVTKGMTKIEKVVQAADEDSEADYADDADVSFEGGRNLRKLQEDMEQLIAEKAAAEFEKVLKTLTGKNITLKNIYTKLAVFEKGLGEVGLSEVYTNARNEAIKNLVTKFPKASALRMVIGYVSKQLEAGKNFAEVMAQAAKTLTPQTT